MSKGRFITLEGGEGAGKSTLARALSERLDAAGLKARTTREPGGSPKAEAIRAMILAGQARVQTASRLGGQAQPRMKSIAYEKRMGLKRRRFYTICDALPGKRAGAVPAIHPAPPSYSNSAFTPHKLQVADSTH